MSVNGTEVGVATLSVLPQIKGLGKAMESEIASSMGAVTKVGNRAGLGLTKGITKGAESAFKELEVLEREHAVQARKSAQAVENARESEVAASRKLAIEEARLQELRDKGTAKTSQLLTAENRLATAKQAHRAATQKLTTATAAQTAQQDKFNTELADAKKAADETGKGFNSLGSRIKSSLGLGERALEDFSDAAQNEGKRAGSNFTNAVAETSRRGFGRVGSIIKGGLLSVGAAAAAGVGATLVKGFSRLDALDQAQAKLRGLGYEAGQIKGVMDDSLAAVKGTAFGLDEASAAAAGALAAGIKQGPELQKYLTLIGDSATVAGTSFQDMGSIFNKVASKGKLDGEVLAQLSDAGILGLADLAKHYGVTAEEAQKMVSSGEVSFDEFSKIMNDKLGGAAKESGNTFQGAVKNMFASVGRIGANVLSGIFPQLKSGLGGVTDFLGTLEDKAKPFGEMLGRVLGRGINLIKGLLPTLKTVGSGIRTVFETVSTWVSPVIDGIVAGFRQFKSIQGAVSAGGEALDKLSPPLDSVKQGIEAIAEPARQLATRMQQFALREDVREKTLAVLTLLSKAFGAIATFVTTQVVPALVSIGTMVSAMAAVVLPIVQQLATYLFAKFQEQLPTFIAVFNSIKSVVMDVLTFVGTQIQFFTTAVDFIWSRWGGNIMAVVGVLADYLVTALKGAFDVISGLVKVVTGVLTGDWSKAKEGLTLIARGIFTMLNAQFTAIKGVVVAIFGGLVTSLISKGKSFLNWIATGFKAGLDRVKDFILSPFRFVRDNVPAVLTSIRNKFYSVVSWLGSTFKNGVAKVKDFFLAPFRAARDGFNAIKDGITSRVTSAVKSVTKIWDGIKKAAKDPVRFVVETVINNGLLGAFRSVARKLGLTSLADGMRVSLPRGFRTGGSTGNLPRNAVAGVVHGNEHVATAEEVARTPGGHRTWERIRGAIRGGSTGFLSALPGYRSGGAVAPVPGRGNRHTSGYGWTTWAGDYPQPMGTPVRAWKDGVVALVRSIATSYGNHIRINHDDGSSSLYAHLSRIGVAIGQRVTAGMRIGAVGSTGNSTGPHLHFETAGGAYNPGSAESGGGFDFLGSLTSGLDKAMGKLDELGNSPIAQMVKGVPGKVKGLLLEKARNLITDAAGSVAGAAKGAASAAVWSPVATAALLKVGQFSPSNLASTLRRLNQESGGNPKAINNWDINAKNGTPSKGLMQVIQPTFDAYRDPSLSSNIYDPLANMVASMRYALARYGSLKAAYDRPGGYASGTNNARKGLHWVGEEGPELMGFAGGETVIPHKASVSLAGMAQSGGDLARGFARGVLATSVAADAVASMAQGAIDTANDVLGIASPSKVFTTVGRWVAEGLAKGVKGSSKTVTSTLSTLRTNMEKVFEDRAKTRKNVVVDRLEGQVAKYKKLAKKQPRYTKRLKKAEADLSRARKADTHGPAVRAAASVMERFNRTTAALRKNAAQRENVAGRLAAAQTKLSDAIKVRDEFKAGVRSSVREFGSVMVDAANPRMLTDILRNRLKTVQSFTQNLARLRKSGLNNQAYAELVAAGPEAGNAQAALILKGGAKAVRSINQLQADINKAGGGLADTAGNALYQSGVNAAQGLVNGLLKEQKNLDRVANSMANSLVKAVKKALKIKSPSRVFMSVGEFIPQGLAMGIEADSKSVYTAMDNLTTNIVMPKTAVATQPYSHIDPAQVSTTQNIYVQNPWTGDYMLAKTATVADKRIAQTVNQAGYART